MTQVSASPLLITGLADVAVRYKVFLIDIVGVVHDGIGAYPGVVETLNTLIATEKTVLFLSNTPRPSSVVSAMLQDLGMQRGFQIFTSGDAVELFFKTQPGVRIFHVGRQDHSPLRMSSTVHTVDRLEDADWVVLSLFVDEDESLTQFDDLLAEIARKRIPVLCANPDKIASHGDRVRYCAGTFGEKLEHLGAQVVYCGKPSLDFYALCETTCFPGQPIPKNQCLMIGDTVETDVEGAQRFGIDSLLVLTGNAGHTLQESEISLTALERFRALFPTAHPTYIAPKL